MSPQFVYRGMKWKQILCGVLTTALLVPPSPASPSQPFKTRLDREKKVVHALDRLTFGPRPGDYAEVKRLGLQKWIDRQLHPERIPENPLLESKLAPLESLRMSPEEVARHYPPPQMVKAIADGRQPMPDDPILRTSLTRLVARYKAKTGAAEEEALEPVRPLDRILDPAQIGTIKRGSADQKRQLLSKLSTADLDDLIVALPPPMRQQLFVAAPVDVRRKILLLRAPQQVVAYDLLESKMLRAVYSNRQLAEELDDFWFNHFNVFYDKGADRFLIPSYERDAIRPNVLGSFRTCWKPQPRARPCCSIWIIQSGAAPARTGAAERKLWPRVAGTAHARRERRLHSAGRNGSGALLHRLDHSRAPERRRFLLQRQDPRQGREGGPGPYDSGRRRHGGWRKGARHSGRSSLHREVYISRSWRSASLPTILRRCWWTGWRRRSWPRHGDIREVMKTMLASKEFWSAGRLPGQGENAV